jgi:cytochrome P450
VTLVWHLVAQNPNVEARLHSELDEVLGERHPVAEDLQRLEYTRRVVDETLRIYPPAWIIGRQALDDMHIGGHAVRAGTILLMSQLVTHRDKRFYDNPLMFDPDRWAPEKREKRPEFAYFPFSGGPRGCLGAHFATLMMPLLIATISQTWRLRLLDRRVHNTELRPGLALWPKENLMMTVEQRVDARSMARA